MDSSQLRHNWTQAGMMRCCVATLSQRVNNGDPPIPHELLMCEHCPSVLRYDPDRRPAAWVWDADRYRENV